jgi:predicted TIM-barrel fold metal-dependent hydrolase
VLYELGSDDVMDRLANPSMPGHAADWLDQWLEEPLEPSLPIVDPHHHLWSNGPSRYMLEELLADIGSGHNVLATVFVEWLSMYRADGPPEMKPVGETEFINGIAAMSASGEYGPARVCAGIVGKADLRLGAAIGKVLEAHLRAGGDRFKGVRFVVSHDPDPDVMNPTWPMQPHVLGDRRFREGFALLEPLGLSFDAMLYHPQLPELIDLVDSFPTTRIVLDHIGAPIGIGVYAGRREEQFGRWARDIRELARRPNVWLKLGGMAQRVNGLDFNKREKPPSSEQLADIWRPWVETCIEAFGPSRCMFESNFPVDKVSYSYPVLWNAFKRLASGAGAEEKADLFHRSACRFYRLDLPGFHEASA